MALIPEMHDILKLTNYRHNFEDFDLKGVIEKSETWNGVLEHHCSERFEFYPTSYQTFILCIADNLASSFSRPEFGDQIKEVRRKIYKLWNPDLTDEKCFYDKSIDKNKIIELMKDTKNIKSGEEYLNKYKSMLKVRTEDANPLRNITSLYTHSKLTGQFYRILINSEKFQMDRKELVSLEYKKIHNLIKVKMKEWKLSVAKIKFYFHQKPIRARDLNVLLQLKSLINDICDKYNDNVMYKGTNEIIVISPDDKILENIYEMVKSKNFWIKVFYEYDKNELERLKPDPEIRASKKFNIYKDLPEKIEIPICEICQMESATKRWPIDYIYSKIDLCEKCLLMLNEIDIDSIYDNLCDIDKNKVVDIIEDKTPEKLCQYCYDVRVEGIKLKKLKQWTELENVKTVWLEISLDVSKLINVLENLYFEYVKSIEPNFKRDKIEVRFSLISEFLEDYYKFLDYFKEKLIEYFIFSNIEIINEGFFCIKAEKNKDILKILKIYNDFFNEYFPKFKTVDKSPIKFTAVYCNSKFPFFEVWRLIESSNKDLSIHYIGKGPICSNVSSLDQITMAIDEKNFRRSSLHDLAEISKLSEKLAELKFKDKNERTDFKTYSLISKYLPLGMDFKSILTFSKLLED